MAHFAVLATPADNRGSLFWLSITKLIIKLLDWEKITIPSLLSVFAHTPKNVF
jgi:hypothetical protein